MGKNARMMAGQNKFGYFHKQQPNIQPTNKITKNSVNSVSVSVWFSVARFLLPPLHDAQEGGRDTETETRKTVLHVNLSEYIIFCH